MAGLRSRGNVDDTVMETEELGFGVGVVGIVKEAAKVLRSHSRLFTNLTLTLILPLCVVGLGHNLITEPIAARVQWDVFFLDTMSQVKGRTPSTQEEVDYVDADLHRELTRLYAALAVYLLFLLAFSLLSTAAIVYSVACVYTAKTTSYRAVLSVVPRVWRRLMATFMWALLLYVAYGVAFMAVFTLVSVLWLGILFPGSGLATALLSWAGTLSFLSGLLYLSCVWHLASVVTVLEDEQSYGLLAMKKAVFLIKGKLAIALGLFLSYAVLGFFISLCFELGVVHTSSSGLGSMAYRFFLACALVVGLSLLDLFGFLVQTIFYFACKAYHHESIDRLCLSEHLEAYLGEYMPLRGSNPPGSLQLETLDP